MFKITIYGQAPSINSLYRIGKDGNLYLTRTGKTYKAAVREILSAQLIKLPSELRGKPLKATFRWWFIHLWERNGNPVRRDYDGPIKIVQDALAEALKFDDCWIFEANVEKRKGGREKSVVTLEPYTLQPCEDDE